MKTRLSKERLVNWIKDIAPAIGVLLFSIVCAIFYGDFAPLTKWKSDVWMVLFRFARFTIVLCLPILILPKIYFFMVRKLKDSLIRIEQEEQSITPFKHWVFRPVQGIGIGLVFSTKLIAVLQIISGPGDSSSLLIAESHYQFVRLAAVTLITSCVSILLSTLWTFDDSGVRYINKKDQELKMIGKYAGTVVPFILGIYGIFSMLANYETIEAATLILKIAIVLYPPLCVFAVIHFYYIKNSTKLFNKNITIRKGGIFIK